MRDNNLTLDKRPTVADLAPREQKFLTWHRERPAESQWLIRSLAKDIADLKRDGFTLKEIEDRLRSNYGL